MSPGPGRDVHALVENLFRREHARLVAGLARVFGPGHLDLVEDVVQEALVRALRVWPYEGVPERPEAWLVRVARNIAADHARRRTPQAIGAEDLDAWVAARTEDPRAVEFNRDDQLSMVFACCHPALAFDDRVALTLQICCGLTAVEIARAFRSDPATVAQRLVRTKRRVREERIALEVPDPDDVHARLDAVLDVVYLLFNEGYAASQGEEHVRVDLTEEALRLGDLLASSPRTALPRTHALLALLGFLAARLAVRTDEHGAIVTLARQDRARWDRARLARAWRHFEAALAGDELTPTHVEAAIAACHAAAPTYADTDWAAILARYDQLLVLRPTVIVRLNRTVAWARVHGARAGLDELEAIERDHPEIARDHLLHATRGLLAWHRGDRERAADAFARALECVRTEPERRLLEARLAAVRAGAPPEEF